MPWLSSTLLSGKLSTDGTAPNRPASEQAVSLPPSFTLYISCSALYILVHLKKMQESRTRIPPSLSQLGFLPYRKGCFSAMLISKKKYTKPVFQSFQYAHRSEASFITQVYETGILQWMWYSLSYMPLSSLPHSSSLASRNRLYNRKERSASHSPWKSLGLPVQWKLHEVHVQKQSSICKRGSISSLLRRGIPVKVDYAKYLPTLGAQARSGRHSGRAGVYSAEIHLTYIYLLERQEGHLQ